MCDKDCKEEDSNDMGSSVFCTVAYSPLSNDENHTVSSIVKKLQGQARIDVGPLHSFTDNGDFTGFKVTASNDSFVCNMPFCDQMFFGISVCMVESNDTVLSTFLMNKAQYEKKLRNMVDEINKSIDSGVSVASFDCIPDEHFGVCRDTGESTRIHSSRGKGVDSKQWIPEPPKSIGVYHGYIRLASGERASRLFIVCEGGCDSLCMQYFNMMFDLRENATLGEAVSSEETWWVKNACSRARNRLLFMACEELQLECKNVITDVYSFEERKMVVPLNETLHFDFIKGKNNKVVLLNGLADTQRIKNGLCCRMSDKEGFWIFRGSPHRNGSSLFGGSFGYNDSSSLFPVWSHCNMAGGKCKKEMHFGNDMLQYLTKTGWDRDWGVAELVPLCTYQCKGV